MTMIVVGLFEDFATANKAVQELTGSGIHPDEIALISHESGQNRAAATSAGTLSNFFNSLFGSDSSDEASHYAEAVRRGSAVISVNAEDNQVERAAEVMNRYGAIDINSRSAQYRASGFTNHDPSAPAYTMEEARREHETYRDTGGGEVAIPIVEEELRVGKRVVQHSGVRIYNRITEQPVEETVTLREEQVKVERRPVNRAVSDADISNFKEGVIEITEMAEEAVVNKRARVVEEIVVNKETVAHDETIRDTVRRTDIEVEEIDGQRARGRSTT